MRTILELVVCFKQNLRKYMRERNITQSELSEMTGISRSAISKYIGEAYQVPDVYSLINIAHALTVSVSNLIGFEKLVEKEK